MSLFKSREWWSAKSGIGESFGAQHMCIGSYEGNNGAQSVIIVGSIEGYLRIYDPPIPSCEASSSSDLLLETQLALPILAVQVIRFNNTEGLHIAVLHPKHLRILRVIIIESTDMNSHCTIDIMYEHQLPLHGHTLTVGPFWQCVQSLTEGTLMFFENERGGMSCKLPALHLLPSPMCYVSSTDSFVVCDSAWNLHSFNYQSLANAALENRTTSSTNKLLSDWQLELSEPAIDIQSTNSFIVTLSEKHLYCLNDNGSIVWARKLDYHPMCLHLLIPPDFPDSVVVLVCTDANTLLVYKDNIVEWNCKLPFSPIVIQTATFQSVQGLIVTMSADGQLNVSFMGTQQVQYGFLQAPQRPFNYEQGIKEIETLTQSLHLGNLKSVFPEENETDIIMELESELCREYIGTQESVDGIRGQLKVEMLNKPKVDVRIFIQCDSQIVATPSETTLPLDSEGRGTLSVLFYVAPVRSRIVCSLCVNISAISLLGESNSKSKQIFLPLHLVTRLATPVREAVVKMTLSTNQPVVNLSHLFRDFPVDDSAMANVIAFQHLNGMVVSILASKTTNKYRLQSDSLAALALFVVEIQKRLRYHFDDVTNFQMMLESPLPLEETWHRIEAHFESYNDLNKEIVHLGQTSRQFQIIQRHFHNKILNAKTVDSAKGIFYALQLAHDQVTKSIQKVEQRQQKFKIETNYLDGAIQCILSLLQIENKSDSFLKIRTLEKILIPVEQLDMEQPWQQTVDNKLKYLTKPQNHSKGPQPSSSSKDFHLPNFKKSFFHAFDSLLK